MWLFKVLDCRNCFLHTTHSNGFSPYLRSIKIMRFNIWRDFQDGLRNESKVDKNKSLIMSTIQLFWNFNISLFLNFFFHHHLEFLSVVTFYWWINLPCGSWCGCLENLIDGIVCHSKSNCRVFRPRNWKN